MGFLKGCLFVCVCVCPRWGPFQKERKMLVVFKPSVLETMFVFRGMQCGAIPVMRIIRYIGAHDSTYRLINNTSETHRFSADF